MSGRPSIPAAVARQLRQEAGFGCCFCGHPFIEYHHIVEWSEEQHFRPEDMMVACPNCHLLCRSVISEAEQRKAKGRPKNVVEGLARGQIYVNSTKLQVDFGGGIAINTPRLLTVGDDVCLVGARLGTEGDVLVSAVIQDRAGAEIARIVDNHWQANIGDVWDLECHPLHAKVRLALRKIAFELESDEDRLLLRGEWFVRGVPVVFTSKEVRIGSSRIISGSVVEDCQNFLNIDV